MANSAQDVKGLFRGRSENTVSASASVSWRSARKSGYCLAYVRDIERPSPPVLRDVTEHPVLDLVPLARARREVADRNPQPQLVGQALQLQLPQAAATAVGATPVARHQQPPGPRIGRLPHFPPPAPQRFHREFRGVVVHPDADPPDVRRHVVDPVRDCLAQLLVGEIMHLHLLRLPLRPPLPPPVPVRPHQLLLLRVDRHNRLAPALELLHPPVDVQELRVPVRMLPPFQRLAIRLQAVTQHVQQAIDRSLAHGVPFRPQLLRQPGCAAAGPAQRPHRVPARHRIELALQRLGQLRVPLRQPLATASRTPQPLPLTWRDRDCPRLQFPQA